MTTNPQISNLFQNIFWNCPFRNSLESIYQPHKKLSLLLLGKTCSQSIFFPFPSFNLVPASP